MCGEKFHPTPGVPETLEIEKPSEETEEFSNPTKESAEEDNRRACSWALKEYFKRNGPSIRGSYKRDDENSNLTLYPNYRTLIKKEKARGGGKKEITRRFNDDLGALERQYNGLLDILPSKDRKTLPNFNQNELVSEKQWQEFIDKKFFIIDKSVEDWYEEMEFDENGKKVKKRFKTLVDTKNADAGAFLNRSQNILEIAKQIRMAAAFLPAEKFAEEKRERKKAV